MVSGFTAQLDARRLRPSQEDELLWKSELLRRLRMNKPNKLRKRDKARDKAPGLENGRRGSMLSPGAQRCPSLHVFTSPEAPRALSHSLQIVHCKNLCMPEDKKGVGNTGVSIKLVCLLCLGVTAARSRLHRV